MVAVVRGRNRGREPACLIDSQKEAACDSILQRCRWLPAFYGAPPYSSFRSQLDLAELLLQLCGSIFPGYRPGTGMGSVVTGTIYALVDGVIGGAIFGWLYNLFAARKAE